MVNILSWIFSIFFFIIAFGSLANQYFLSTVMYLAISALLLPPFNNLLWAKKNFKITKGVKTVLIILCLLVTGAEVSLTKGKKPVIPEETKAEAPQQKKEEPKQATYSIGDKIKVDYTTYKVNNKKWQSRIGNEYIGQSANSKYLLINITVENNDKESRLIAPFKLVDENNAEYDTEPSAEIYLGDKAFIFSSLNPGVSKTGTLIFDVPTTHTYKLLVKGGYWSDKEILINLSKASPKKPAKPTINQPKEPITNANKIINTNKTEIETPKELPTKAKTPIVHKETTHKPKTPTTHKATVYKRTHTTQKPTTTIKKEKTKLDKAESDFLN